ncbi:diguanylate cyclase [Oceanispirochaeta sp.]|jgi:diguanylate cyclase (GGDEF)-like protein/PAS domain S-box-containing protein|uniref:sensor domain-containing diguanylate cyclase n=1 Tax=Oceanispirochaeta sp. TaxID=2035350 RepID=UPI00260DB9A2|nr:diguanylate cyclase [Oceanispirochaeta sp.]MDA3956165.1 diguanylate cyclase [Oceanispirochaeta sp.]
MNISCSLVDPNIILTDKMPLGSDGHLTPEYDTVLQSAGLYPWFWDFNKNQIHLTTNLLDLLELTDLKDSNLYSFIFSQLERKDAQHFFRILKSIIRMKKIEEKNFRLKKRTGKVSPWLRISGTFLKKKGQIYGAVGHVRNINELVNQEDSLEENREFLNTLINLVPLPIYYKNQSGQFQFYNNAYSKILRLSVDEIHGKTVYDIYDRDQAEILSRDDNKLMQKQDVQIFERKVRFRDGRIRDFIIHKTPDYSRKDGRVKGLAGFMLDVTDQKSASRRITRLMDIKELVLEINHAILSIPDLESLLEFILKKIPRVIEGADCGTILLNHNGMLTVTASFGYIMDKTETFSFPLNTSFMIKENQGLPEKAVIINNIQQVISSGNHTPLLPTKSGKTVHSFMGSPIIRNGHTLGLFSLDSFSNNIFTEDDIEVMNYLNEQLAVILDKQELYQEVLGLSRFDSLTGLSNRHFFQEQAHAALNRAGRTGQKLIIVLADLDSLKSVNDFWGHDAGDAMIMTFSRLLKESFRDSDILGRLGGDEFTGVFHDTNRDDLEVRFNSFRETPPSFPVTGGSVSCRFSFGTALYPDDSSSLDELIKIADMNMYRMKEAGKQQRGVVTMEFLLNEKKG